MIKLGIILILVQVALAYSNDYSNYKTFSVVHYQNLRRSSENPLEEFEVLKFKPEVDENGHTITKATYLVPPDSDEAFRKILAEQNMKYEVLSTDLGKDIEEERAVPVGSRRFESRAGIALNQYHSYNDIIAYTKYLEKIKHPQTGKPLVMTEKIAKTYEGRDMYLVKISSDHSKKKPIFYIEIGIHAREWCAPATGVYMMHQLVENYTANAHVLKDIDFYIIPVVNPDGYEYSRSKNRLWRKTRSIYNGAYGTDGNRNFDYHWGESGSSTNPKSDIFQGPTPFSEKETRAVRDAGIKYIKRMNGFLSIHTYGGYILYPWGYTEDELAPKHELMTKVGQEAAKAIAKVRGTKYVVGTSAQALYASAGGSDDYFKGVHGIDLAYTMELWSESNEGFIVPPHKIIPIATEAFEGIKVLALLAAKHNQSQNYDRDE